MSERPDSGGENASGAKGTSAWEWAVAAVGALLVLSVVGLMLYEALTEPSTPPQIEVSVDTIVQNEYGYVIQFQARNHGQITAAGLVVEGELKSDTGTVEKAQVTIDYVPSESRRKGGLLFTHDPRHYTVNVSAKGYDVP